MTKDVLDALRFCGLLEDLSRIVLQFVRELPRPYSAIYPAPLHFLDDRDGFETYDPDELFSLPGT